MVRFLICTVFRGAALVKGRRLIEGGAYSDLSVNGVAIIRERHLFEVRRFLEKISVCNFQSMKSLLSKFFCYIARFVISPDRLDTTLDGLQTRLLRQTLLFLRNNSLAV